MLISSASSWKSYFLVSNKFDYSNSLLKEIHQSVDPSVPVFDSFQKISKNDGITILSLDSLEERLQLFHHPTILGGSWKNKEEKLVAILGLDQDCIPIQISPKSLKDVKAKTFTMEQFAAICDDPASFELSRTPKLNSSAGTLYPFHIYSQKYSLNSKRLILLL